MMNLSSLFFHSPFLPLSVVVAVVFVLMIAAVPASLADEKVYIEYRNCNATTRCGVIPNIPYPFWGGRRPDYCGGGHRSFYLHCPGNDYDHPTIMLGSMQYVVYDISPHNGTMKLGQIIHEDVCATPPPSTTLDFAHFSFVESADRNLTLYHNCASEPPDAWDNFTYDCNGGRNDVYYASDTLLHHGTLTLPPAWRCADQVTLVVIQSSLDRLVLKQLNLVETLETGFLVQYQLPLEQDCVSCLSRGGLCGSVPKSTTFACITRDGPSLTGKRGPNRKKITIIVAGVVVIGVAGLSLLCIIWLYFRRKMNKFIHLGQSPTANEQDLEACIRKYGPLPLSRYSFTDVKKMTNSFQEKLGSGGYGSVFKGKLSNSQLVAVKVLSPSKRDGQEFINEVAGISRTSHVNIVTLLGYCIEGEKRALVYEFMPNGSLEKFIYNDNRLNARQDLGWEKLYQIALGIAQGLEYLHSGCKTRILHFDIKPHNILLDEHFCPKISDFGLAKLSTNNESIVSMVEARGTIGFIAPEVFSRNFGHVSHKSDVYSYGMMILEMVGRRKNINVGVSRTSEIYFPHWIYDQLKIGEAFTLPSIIRHEENDIAKKMALIGLWCIQTLPSDRPSMGEVIDMLKGSVEALKLPPKPFITSPERSPPRSTSSLHTSQCDSTV